MATTMLVIYGFLGFFGTIIFFGLNGDKTAIWKILHYVLYVGPVWLFFWVGFLKVRDQSKKIKIDAENALREKALQEQFIESVARRCGHEPIFAVVVGGSGFNIQKDDVVLISCRDQDVAISLIKSQREIEIPISQLINIEVSGPGKVKKNAGLIGGGFGIEGAMKGILVAAAINALTTKTKITTFLRLATNTSELHFLITTLDTSELRLILSPAFVKVEATTSSQSNGSAVNSQNVSEEVKKLHSLLKDGVLTADEFAAAKAKLLA